MINYNYNNDIVSKLIYINFNFMYTKNNDYNICDKNHLLQLSNPTLYYAYLFFLLLYSYLALPYLAYPTLSTFLFFNTNTNNTTNK